MLVNMCCPMGASYCNDYKRVVGKDRKKGGSKNSFWKVCIVREFTDRQRRREQQGPKQESMIGLARDDGDVRREMRETYR